MADESQGQVPPIVGETAKIFTEVAGEIGTFIGGPFGAGGGRTQMDVPAVQKVGSQIEVCLEAARIAEAQYQKILAEDLAEAACCSGMNAAKLAYDLHILEELIRFENTCLEGISLIRNSISAITQTDQGEAQNFQA